MKRSELTEPRSSDEITADTDESDVASTVSRPASIFSPRRLVIAGLWLAAVVAWFSYQRANDLSTLEVAQRFVDASSGASWAAVAFVVVYAIRPILLFPASLLTIGGGILFGPIWGVLLTIIGANLSAMVAYWIGRGLGSADDRTGSPAAEHRPNVDGFVARWADQMRNNGFVTVLIMRLLYLPYDLINYAAGFLRIPPLAFLAATAIGSLPGTVAFVLAGASIETISDGPSGVDRTILAVSVALFVTSLGISRWLRRRRLPTAVPVSDEAAASDE